MPFIAANPYLDAVIIAVALYAVIAMWDSLVKPLLFGLAALLDFTIPMPRWVPDIHLSAVANAIRTFEQKIRHDLGKLLAHLVWPFAMLLEFAATLFLAPARELFELARDTTATIDRLRRDVIPAMIAAKVAWIPRHIAALEHQAVHVVTRVSRVVVHEVPHVVKPTVIRVARSVANPALPRIGSLERDAVALGKRIDRLARSVAPATLAAAVAVALARTVGGWVRCSRVKRVGRQICGMDESLLEGLIADTLLIVGAISIVEFAEALQAVESEVVAGLRGFVKEI